MDTIKLSPINSRGFEIKDAEDKRKLNGIATAMRKSYEAAYYVAKALGFKNVGEMEQAMFPENS